MMTAGPTHPYSWRRLTLSGGGMKGMAYVGMLKAMEDNPGLVDGIREITGTSIGAMFGLLMMLGYTSSELTELFLDSIDFSRMVQGSSLSNLLTPGITGLDDGAYMETVMEEMLTRKGVSPTLTFRGAHDLGFRRLCCVVTNLSRRSDMFLNIDTVPDLRVVDAVRMSMAVPFLFAHGTLEGDIIVDGGLTNNLPVNGFSGARYNGPSRILACYLENGRYSPPVCSSSGSASASAGPDVIFMNTLDCLMRQLGKYELLRCQQDSSIDLVAVPAATASTFQMDISRECKVTLFDTAYSSVRPQLTKLLSDMAAPLFTIQ